MIDIQELTLAELYALKAEVAWLRAESDRLRAVIESLEARNRLLQSTAGYEKSEAVRDTWQKANAMLDVLFDKKEES